MPYVIYHTLQASIPGACYSSQARRIEIDPPMEAGGVTMGQPAPDMTAVEVCGRYSGPNRECREFFLQKDGWGEAWWFHLSAEKWWVKDGVSFREADPPAILVWLAERPIPAYTPPGEAEYA